MLQKFLVSYTISRASFMIDEKAYEYKVTASGRVNIIGEHVDYCGGKVMPCALSLKNTVYVRANNTNSINVKWTTVSDTVTISLDKLSECDHKHAKYIAGCAHLWRKAGHKVVGCDMLIDCNVPFGSGLSSSAAIEVSAIVALAVVAGEQPNSVEVALTAQKAEHEFAGVMCGIMDQYASACGKAGHAMLLDCSTLDCQYIPVKLGEYSIVLIDSNKPHNLVESKYNERRAETEEALRLLQQKLNVSCLAEVTARQLEENRQILPPIVYKRAKHVVDECDRVRIAATAMREGNVRVLGEVLNASHKSLADLYEVTGRELDVLAYTAQAYPHCVGSRMTGGGFGGCTVSLVETHAVEDFKRFVAQEYTRQTGYNALCYDVEISDGITYEKI